MCLAVPVRITELLSDQMAKVSLGGVSKTVSVALVDDLERRRLLERQQTPSPNPAE